jgi:hypothetical protein
LLWTGAFVVGAGAAEPGLYKARLNGVGLWIDQQTGSIERLSSSATGVLLDATPEQSGVLDLAYPTKEFTPLRLASRFS